MLQTVFLFAVLIIAVIYDFWKCRIPNWLVVIGYFVGIAGALWQDKLWYFRLTDSLLMLLILYPLFLLCYTFGLKICCLLKRSEKISNLHIS